jgi:excisionase family DNA binding protein
VIQKQFTTREAAKAVGITRATVQAWIAAKKIKAPKATTFAGMMVRMWSQADVQKLRAVKNKIYMKGRGPKAK